MFLHVNESSFPIAICQKTVLPLLNGLGALAENHLTIYVRSTAGNAYTFNHFLYCIATLCNAQWDYGVKATENPKQVRHTPHSIGGKTEASGKSTWSSACANTEFRERLLK